MSVVHEFLCNAGSIPEISSSCVWVVEFVEVDVDKLLLVVSVLLLSVCLSGCPATSQCAKEAEKACEETAVTIQYFNDLAGGERYNIEDCLKLIPLQCPPGVQ